MLALVNLLVNMFLRRLIVVAVLCAVLKCSEVESVSFSSISENQLSELKTNCSHGGLYLQLNRDAHELEDSFLKELNSLSVALKIAVPGFCISVVKIAKEASQQLSFDLPAIQRKGTITTPELISNVDSFGKQIIKELFGIKTLSNDAEIEQFLADKSGIHTPSLMISSNPFKDVPVELGGYLHQINAHNQWFCFGVAFVAGSQKYLDEHKTHVAVVTRSRFTDGQILVHTGHWGSDSVQAHLISASNPVIANFDREDSPSSILGRNIPCLFLIGHDKQSKEYQEFTKVAEILRNDILFVWADPQTGVSQRLIGFLKLSHQDIGNGIFLLKHYYGQVHKWKYTHEQITKALIEHFIEEYTAGKLPRYFHSQQPPAESENQGPVYQAVGKTFKQMVLADDNTNVIVDFYGLYCGHCVTFAPIYEEVAREMKQMNMNIRFIKIEMSDNEIENEAIYQYPTIKLYPAKRKNRAIQFEGPRSKEHLLDFIKKNIDQTVETQDI